ncbi:hypothetical protein Taro_047961 [Colocasia esculenta]|uniref:Uncharacterized protein n=1 Tax=Colocasia esculenta TaxID=4460 RepID=A0A843X1V1_COLES|nr:hypothetical protein [Colocasia esculenta]
MTIRLQLRMDGDSTMIWAENNFNLSTGALRNTKPELCPGLPVCICRQLALQFCIKSMFKDINVIIKNMIYGKPNILELGFVTPGPLGPLTPSSGSRQGDCRDVVPTASVSGSIWDCDMGRHGLCRLPIASPQTQSDRRDKRPLCQYGSGGVGRHTHCRLLVPVATGWYVAFTRSGLKARAPEPFPLSRASPFPLSLSRPLGVPAFLGCLPRIEAAVLRRLSLRSCRGRGWECENSMLV